MSLVDKVKSRPLAEIVQAFFPSVDFKPAGRNLVCCCVLHAEKTPSFNINVEQNRFRCFGCGASGSCIDLVIKAGLADKPLKAARLIAEKFGIRDDDKAQGRKGSVKHGTAEQAGDGLTLSMLAEAKKIPEKFLWDLGLRNWRYRGSPAVFMPYWDSSGELYAQRYRLKLSDDGNGTRFIWRSGARTSLYGLERIKDIEKAGWCLLVEGESDCWTAWLHELPALGIPGKNTWKSEWSKYFAGVNILVWQEPDAEDFSESIAKDLPDIWVIEAPGDVKDISEAHIAGRDIPAFIDELKAGASQASRLKKDKSERDRDHLKKKAAQILAHPDPIDLVTTSLRTLGIGGDITPALVVYASLTSPLLKMRQGSMPCHLMLLGLSSTGKSHTLKVVLLLLPAETYHSIDSGSPHVLIYAKFETKHRVVIFSESDSLPAGEDNACASAIRNLLQENEMVYDVVIRDPQTGEFVVQRIKKPGPTLLVTTSTRRLGAQLDTRVFSLEIPDDVNQVREALQTQGNIEIYGTVAPSADLIDFQAYLQSLAPVDVIVPYAPQLAELIGKTVIAPRILRDFAKLISLIKSVTVIRHAHRKVDAAGRFVATVDDYRSVYGWVSQMYETTATGASENVRRVVEAVAKLSKDLSHQPITNSLLADLFFY